ncbi:MAG: hypothetical protein V4485_00380 [Pseudomonadota bacterium]
MSAILARRRTQEFKELLNIALVGIDERVLIFLRVDITYLITPPCARGDPRNNKNFYLRDFGL